MKCRLLVMFFSSTITLLFGVYLGKNSVEIDYSKHVEEDNCNKSQVSIQSENAGSECECEKLPPRIEHNYCAPTIKQCNEFVQTALDKQAELLSSFPINWPNDIEGKFREENIRRYLKDYTQECPDYQVLNISCSEYPCIALIQPVQGIKTEECNFHGDIKEHITIAKMAGAIEPGGDHIVTIAYAFLANHPIEEHPFFRDRIKTRASIMELPTFRAP